MASGQLGDAVSRGELADAGSPAPTMSADDLDRLLGIA